MDDAETLKRFEELETPEVDRFSVDIGETKVGDVDKGELERGGVTLLLLEVGGLEGQNLGKFSLVQAGMFVVTGTFAYTPYSRARPARPGVVESLEATINPSPSRRRIPSCSRDTYLAAKLPSLARVSRMVELDTKRCATLRATRTRGTRARA